MTRGTSLRIAVLAACVQLALPALGRAEEEAEERNFGPGYYKAPGISLLSNEGKGWDLSDSLLGEDAPIDFGGWTQWGYTDGSDGLFNKHPYNVNNHQSWLYVEKKADGSEGFDWGFRVDAMYGVDGADTQSFGNHFGKYDFSNSFNHGIYGWAIPQIYGEFAYKDFAMKAGHFFTPLGYEVVPATGNFFFSHAYTMYLSEPFTHTGFLATYSGIEKLTLYGGWSAGWDTGFDQNKGGNNVIAGLSYAPIDGVTATYLLTGGDLGWIGDGYSHAIVVDTTPMDRLKFVLTSDLTAVESGGADYDTLSVNGYLIYSILDEVGVGTRLEWWKMNGASYNAFTGGLNLKPLPNLTIRPEYRVQFSATADDGRNPAGLPVDDNGIFGIDAIWTF